MNSNDKPRPGALGRASLQKRTTDPEPFIVSRLIINPVMNGH